MGNLKYKVLAFLEDYLGGHLVLGNIVIYGFNAMHVAINIKTRRFGYICFHPTVWVGCWRRWYFYCSTNATPWASSFAFGPGLRKEDKESAYLRRKKYGFVFDDSILVQQRNGAWI